MPRFDQRSTPRRYLFVREPDHPPDLLDAFEPVPDEPTVRRMLGVSA